MTSAIRPSLLALAVTALLPGSAGAQTLQLAASAHHYKDGSYAGSAYDAYWGLVQVQANVQNGQLVSVDILQYPSHRSTSRAINRQAIPMLESEVIRAQGVRVNLISGATLTSEAYLRSLHEALSQASS
jgi:uncharacterized protein with FMN-binding domain